MKKVCFLIPALDAGGAERVMLNLLRSLDRSRFTPLLVLLVKKGILLSDLPSDIRIRTVRGDKNGFFFKLLDSYRIAKLLNEERPDLIISFMWYTNAVTLFSRFIRRIKINIIISERTSTVSYEDFLSNFIRGVVIRFLYPFADTIIAPSYGIKRKLVNNSGISKEKVIVIHNPVDIRTIRVKAEEGLEHTWYQGGKNTLIAVGRLRREKGFAYLLRTVSLLSSEGIDCKLVILGEGKERKNLQDLVNKLRIEDKVFLAGFQSNPYKYLSRSTIFVLSSLYEGFPNVLLEAMALGVPSIATRCQTGPEEIVTDGIDGLLVPPADEKALADAVRRLLLDEDLRKRLGEAGEKRAEDFSSDKIVKEYEALIEGICAESAER